MKRAFYLSLLTLLLNGCYIVPANRANVVRLPNGGTAIAGINTLNSITMSSFSARLYPTNQLAQKQGSGTATINAQGGYGIFSARIGTDNYSGEVSRDSSDGQRGSANGSNGRGSYISCTYSMGNDTQHGKGSCRTTEGATFDMHISAGTS